MVSAMKLKYIGAETIESYKKNNKSIVRVFPAFSSLLGFGSVVFYVKRCCKISFNMTSNDKRVLETTPSWNKTPVVILDIEGTTTAISFVKETLFPYVRSNIEQYVKDHWTDDEFKAILEQLIEQAGKDVAEKVEGAVVLEKDQEDIEKAQKDLVASVLWQMDGDQKTTGLKQLQGHMYRQGYKNGDLKGHVFADVAPALKKLKAAGKQVYIYSSGSAEAQKLLFGNTIEGDLLEFLSGHFDTEVGPKRDSESYVAIAKKVDKKPEEISFLTDIVEEAEAAKKAGLLAVLVEREGNAELSADEKAAFPVISTLAFEEEEEEGESPPKKLKSDAVVVDKDGDIEMVDLEEESEKKEEPEKKKEAAVEEAEAAKEEEKKPETEAAAKEEETAKPVEEEKTEEASPVEEIATVEEVKAEEKTVEVEKVSETNGTKPHENGTTNGSEDKTNGETNGESAKTGEAESNGKSEESAAAVEEKVKEVSPTKKAVIEAAEEAPEAAKCAE